MADTIKLTIDGKEVEVPKGTTVLQAADRMGLDVPRYCYHDGLTIAGNCRICLVDIEKMPKLVTSCTTQAAEGMVVRTSGAKVEDGRKAVMEFLLANHPLDCPICDQAGECRLQQYSFEHGRGGTRFAEEKIKGFKAQSIGPHIELDTERCIVCTRCVRFCDEVTKTGELGVFQRGAYSYIDVFPGTELGNAYSGNTVDICPVGALTLKEFRFRKRVWELKDVPSTCGACARGCNVNLGTADEQIWRMTPRQNMDVNKWWMCDEGRLSYQPTHERPRLREALARWDGPPMAMSYPKALDFLAGRIAAAGPGGVGVIASGSLTLEDFYMLRRFASEAAKGARIVVPENRRGEDDAILIRADKNANSAGAALMGMPVDAGGHAHEALLRDAVAGKVDVLLVLGDDLVSEGRVAQLAPARGRLFICKSGAFESPLTAAAGLALPAPAYGEFEGTWVNYQGRAQWVRRGITPRHVAPETWRLLAELMVRAGIAAHFASAAEVLAEAGQRVEALHGLTARALGTQGVGLATAGAVKP